MIAEGYYLTPKWYIEIIDLVCPKSNSVFRKEFDTHTVVCVLQNQVIMSRDNIFEQTQEFFVLGQPETKIEMTQPLYQTSGVLLDQSRFWITDHSESLTPETFILAIEVCLSNHATTIFSCFDHNA